MLLLLLQVGHQLISQQLSTAPKTTNLFLKSLTLKALQIHSNLRCCRGQWFAPTMLQDTRVNSLTNFLSTLNKRHRTRNFIVSIMMHVTLEAMTYYSERIYINLIPRTIGIAAGIETKINAF